MSNTTSWEARFVALHQQGADLHSIADDPVIRATLLQGVDDRQSRYTRCWRTERRMLKEGLLQPRTRKQKQLVEEEEPAQEALTRKRGNEPEGPVAQMLATPAPARFRELDDVNIQAVPELRDELGLPGGKSRADAILEEFEKALGHYRRYEQALQGDRRGRKEYIVASDFHVADERQDLLAELVAKHRHKELIIGGDFFDFSDISRHPPNGWNDPRLSEVMSRGAAILDLLQSNFHSVTLVIGNHDHRAWKKALHNVSTEYGRFTHECFLYMLRHKFGVNVVDHVLTHQNGRQLEGVHFYHQVGDCLISHSEHCGRPTGKGADGALDFFDSWQSVLGLDPFRVILQAHTHKQSYHRSRNNRVHLYEIGCMCDWQNYAIQGRQSFGPPQHGYFHLVQHDGVTDVNESRLVCLDD